MKKLLTLLLALTMLFSCVTLSSAAAESKSFSGVDIVFVIDMSGSMTNEQQSDPLGYRIDAVEMVMAMAGMDNTRVAFVPFGDTIDTEHADTEFVDINSVADREKKMKQIDTLRSADDAHGHGTDFSDATAYAYNLLANRKDASNEPMIILLTDGYFYGASVDPDAGNARYTEKMYYVWSEDEERFVYAEREDGTTKPVRVYSNHNSKKHRMTALMESVTEQCANAGYPIYTVALVSSNDVDHIQYLADVSRKTGAKSASVHSSRPEQLQQLPTFFAEMFAERIGSSSPIRCKYTALGDGWYEVAVPVPNTAIMEANLYVPLAGIVRNTMELHDANGNTPAEGAVLTMASANFILFKLNHPAPSGEWKLTFQVDDPNNAAEIISNISFNILYNYGITLHGAVGTSWSNASEDGMTMGRGANLYIRAQFYENSTGSATPESSLYALYPNDDPSTDDDDWYSICATYELQRQNEGGVWSAVLKNDGTVIGGEMDRKTDCFVIESLDLGKACTNAEGYNILPAGQYRVRITAEGAGLSRQTYIPFEMVNTAPADQYVNGLVLDPIYVDYEESDHPGSTEVQTFSHNMTEILADADNDRISITFTPEAGADDILDWELTADGKFTYATKTDANGLFKYGDFKGAFTVTDGTATSTIPLTVKVNSGLNTAYNDWDLLVTHNAPVTPVLKNTPIDIRLEIAPAGKTTPDTNGAIRQFAAKVYYTSESNPNAIVDSFDMTLDPAGNAYTYSLLTPEYAGKWIVTVETYYGGNSVKSESFTIETPDNAPAVAVGAVKNFTFNHNPLPGALSFIGNPTPEADLRIDLTAIFTDPDNEIPAVTCAQGMDHPGVATFTEDPDHPGVWLVTLDPNADATLALDLTATDADGNACGPVRVHVAVVDLVKLCTRYAILAVLAIIALIILISIIRQILKPKFPRNAVLGVRDGISAYDSCTYEFVPSKKAITMSSVIMMETASAHGVADSSLLNICLQPIRSTNGSIGIRLTRNMNDVVVMLEGQRLLKSKKPTIWMPGASLEISAPGAGEDNFIRVVLYDAQMTAMPADNNFGSFTTSFDNFGANDVSNDFGGYAPSNDSFASNDFSAGSDFAPANDSFAPTNDSFAPAGDVFSGNSQQQQSAADTFNFGDAPFGSGDNKSSGSDNTFTSDF